MSLPVATQASSAVLAALAQRTDSTFKVLYFGLHGRGEGTRTLLALTGAKWEELTVDWATQKPQAPFGCLPVVYEIAASGEVLELAESGAIERYLSRKYSLLGDNLWDENLVNEAINSIEGLHLMYMTSVVREAAEKRLDGYNTFLTSHLARFVDIHEKLLVKRGSNGHYVNNKTSLADVKLVSLVDKILNFVPEGASPAPLSAEQSPQIWKVYQTITSSPSLAAWRKSARSTELDQATKRMFKW